MVQAKDTGSNGAIRSSPSAAKAWFRALELTAPIQKNPQRTFYVLLSELAERHGDAPALLSQSGALTYRELSELANRYARWGIEAGLVKGDRVCLLMPNSQDYLAIWAGLSGIGCIVALLNSNLTGSSLARCVEAADPKIAITAANLAPALVAAQSDLSRDVAVFAHGTEKAEFASIEDALAAMPVDPVTMESVSIKDPALYIYTSGTTGLPKAAKITHYRIMAWSHWFAGLMGVGSEDRLYNCLPMYHSIGGVAAPGALLAGGGSVVIREKFSARNFWKDVAEQDCTIFQYIGELCRYLVNVQETEYEKQHRLRLCCGNGLSAEVWRKFQSRYNIPQILEFYAATEGTFSLYNLEGVPGSIGRVPPFLPQVSQIKLIKYDVEADTISRGDDGFCIPCAPGETGEAIGRISSTPAGRFEGYTSAAESEKKILRNVFEYGDAWFRTGDLMVRDKKGFFYFVDRIGDTFRWKGENVSTSEVRDAIAELPGVLDVTVYGVAVPGSEGRAGMAALAVDERFDLQGLATKLEAHLPLYAQPLFLRLAEKIELTATFKHKKADLVSQGFDPRKVSGKLYFRDPATRAYVSLDDAEFSRIVAGSAKL